MTDRERLLMLENALEIDEGTLKADMSLNNIAEWDSMAILSFIALLDETFHKQVKVGEIRELQTVGQLLEYMK